MLGRIFLFAALGFLYQPAVASEMMPGTGVDILSHEIAITPDFQTQSVSGNARIRLRVQQDRLKAIAFSKNGLVVSAARLDGKPVEIAAGEKNLLFSPRKPLRIGKAVTLEISYHGKPSRGVNFAKTSVFTSYWACDWMFCSQDALADKAAIDVRLTVPAGMKTISVGTLRSITKDHLGRSVHHWREDRPFSSYLYAFAAGDFVETVVRQRGFDLSYLNAIAPAQNMEALFGTTAAMVRFLETKAGLRLPTRRYTQLLVPGSEAQESATYSIIGIKQIEPILDNPENDWVIVHELAHQWWGNLVTSRSLDHFWLNEGITVFITAAWKEHRFGRAAYDAELDIARARLRRAQDAGFDKPLAFPGPYPSLTIRRAVQYSKGALFMDHLRRRLGDELFWASLRHYTQVHAGGTVESRDLQIAFEEASGQSLASEFDEWVYGATTSGSTQAM